MLKIRGLIFSLEPGHIMNWGLVQDFFQSKGAFMITYFQHTCKNDHVRFALTNTVKRQSKMQNSFCIIEKFPWKNAEKLFIHTTFNCFFFFFNSSPVQVSWFGRGGAAENPSTLPWDETIHGHIQWVSVLRSPPVDLHVRYKKWQSLFWISAFTDSSQKDLLKLTGVIPVKYEGMVDEISSFIEIFILDQITPKLNTYMSIRAYFTSSPSLAKVAPTTSPSSCGFWTLFPSLLLYVSWNPPLTWSSERASMWTPEDGSTCQDSTPGTMWDFKKKKKKSKTEHISVLTSSSLLSLLCNSPSHQLLVCWRRWVSSLKRTHRCPQRLRGTTKTPMSCWRLSLISSSVMVLHCFTLCGFSTDAHK